MQPWEALQVTERERVWRPRRTLGRHTDGFIDRTNVTTDYRGMSNQDEPITNNPLLPFLRMASSNESTLAVPHSLTPVQTLALEQQQTRTGKLGVQVDMDKMDEEGKPLRRHFCPNFRVLYMKDGEIRLLGIHVSSPVPIINFKDATLQIQTIISVIQVSNSAPAMLLVLGLLLTTAGWIIFSAESYQLMVTNKAHICHPRQSSHSPRHGPQVSPGSLISQFNAFVFQ